MSTGRKATKRWPQRVSFSNLQLDVPVVNNRIKGIDRNVRSFAVALRALEELREAHLDLGTDHSRPEVKSVMVTFYVPHFPNFGGTEPRRRRPSGGHCGTDQRGISGNDNHWSNGFGEKYSSRLPRLQKDCGLRLGFPCRHSSVLTPENTVRI
ncbi:hypothetical protein niasHT_034993 [Heterodera trifolii]|uniref:Uncharacterized protein n=1 Tax=Heterodera trifolii TaxID=157864 RepID=A0ABD2IDS9_9BILA